MRQQLVPSRTTWHITVGAYGSRLHGAMLPTVDRDHNQFGTPFLPADTRRHDYERGLMKAAPVQFTAEQRVFLEAAIHAVCERGGWTYRIGAAPAPPEDNHIHVLLDADPAVHGKRVRHWLKHWLSEALTDSFGPPPGSAPSWWVSGGSNKPVKDERYLNNAYSYIARQRTTSLGNGAA